uniref:Uncharacterized protein n=1 Tax=Schizaphis graminum TaxID=13262 RepID=A0A2S2N6V5_SCHGA
MQNLHLIYLFLKYYKINIVLFISISTVVHDSALNNSKHQRFNNARDENQNHHMLLTSTCSNKIRHSKYYKYIIVLYVLCIVYSQQTILQNVFIISSVNDRIHRKRLKGKTNMTIIMSLKL